MESVQIFKEDLLACCLLIPNVLSNWKLVWHVFVYFNRFGLRYFPLMQALHYYSKIVILLKMI